MGLPPQHFSISSNAVHMSGDIFVMKADGSNLRQVTRGLGQNIHPMWSSDSSRILFNTTYFAGQGQKDAKTSDEKRVIGENYRQPFSQGNSPKPIPTRAEKKTARVTAPGHGCRPGRQTRDDG
jgi:Tol biopolymer transport system component